MTANALRLVGRSTNVRSIRAAKLLVRMRRSVGRFICGLFGHEMLLHFDADRMCLQCFRCSAQSPGWVIDVNPAFRRCVGHSAKARKVSSTHLARAS